MNRYKQYHQTDVELANLSKVFTDPARLGILITLTTNNDWLKLEELIVPGINVQQLRKHVEALKEVGILLSKIDGKEVLYSICNENLKRVYELFLNFSNEVARTI